MEPPKQAPDQEGGPAFPEILRVPAISGPSDVASLVWSQPTVVDSYECWMPSVAAVSEERFALMCA